jgi:ribose 5-phosphate isomerase B
MGRLTYADRMARIVVGSDHAGLRLKNLLADDLRAAGHDVTDIGTYDDSSVDYPEFGTAVATTVASGDAAFGVLVCGTGIGISIAANRVPGVRAAVCHDTTAARLCREHNDANVACFGERTMGSEVARDALRTFLDTEFAGGRHQGRVDQLG